MNCGIVGKNKFSNLAIQNLISTRWSSEGQCRRIIGQSLTSRTHSMIVKIGCCAINERLGDET